MDPSYAEEPVELTPSRSNYLSLGQRADLTLDTALKFVLGNLEIMARLRIQPETGSRVEITGQSHRGVWRYAAAAMHDFRNSRDRHVKIEGQSVHAKAERPHEILA